MLQKVLAQVERELEMQRASGVKPPVDVIRPVIRESMEKIEHENEERDDMLSD